jgi:hypothetical protein
MLKARFATIFMPGSPLPKILKKNRKKTISRANSESLAVFIGGSMNRSKLCNRISRIFMELITEFNECCGTFTRYRAVF